MQTTRVCSDEASDFEIISFTTQSSSTKDDLLTRNEAPEANYTASDNAAEHPAALERLVLFFAADTTASMASPIIYGVRLMEGCMDYLAGILDIDHIGRLQVVVYVVGMNDWMSGSGESSQPVKLFLNEQESINARKPIGFSFELDKTNAETWQSNMTIVNTAIKAMANSTRENKTNGGDLREEYATGVHFIKTIVEGDKEDFPMANTKYFMLSITDDMQHGMGVGSWSGDTWTGGVLDSDVYGDNDQFAYKYACPYAPDTHPRLGFSCWKPHSFWHSLNGLLGLRVTVVWCPIGKSADHGPGSAFESWVGTLSTVFEYSNGVAISWQGRDGNKPVPATVAHILNTLVTSASVSSALDAEKRSEAAAKKAEALMHSAQQHSQSTGGSLNQVPTTLDEAADLLNEVVVESGLTEMLQGVFIGTVKPDTHSSQAVRAAFQNIQAAHDSGDDVTADNAIAVAYRSLSAECNPGSFAEMSPPPPTPRLRGTKHIRDCASPPLFRSMSVSTTSSAAPVMRSLGSISLRRDMDTCSGSDATVDRSIAAAYVPSTPPPSPVSTKRDSSSSKKRLMRMAAAL